MDHGGHFGKSQSGKYAPSLACHPRPPLIPVHHGHHSLCVSFLAPCLYALVGATLSWCQSDGGAEKVVLAFGEQ